jgi:AcrR family transcriptional regulator
MPIDTSKTKGKSADTLKKLLNVATDLIYAKGFKGTSIRDIASEMNMTSSSIYYYFGTKQGVLSAIEKQIVDLMMKEFKEILKLEIPPKERFELFIRAHLTFINSHRKESQIFTFSEEATSQSKNFQKEIFLLYRSEIERIYSSMGKTEDPTIAAFCTIGIVGWFLKWHRPEGKSSFDEVIDSIIEYIMHGILGNQA